jgi:hypothetical protein
MPIATREEIINHLVKAAELEHGLMIQYLYAEMTLKGPNDGLASDQLSKVSRWRQWISAIARQEMGHLATVLNLLEAVGGGSHLNRLRFPSATGLYTPPIRFSLEPLTRDTVDRFVKFEWPAHVVQLDTLAPVDIPVQHVGQLYEDIRTAIGNFNEADLFIGRGTGQDQSAWSLTITVTPVTNRQTAFAAIDSIVKEGEGNSTGTDDSHYGRFRRIQNEYDQELTKNAGFAPFRNVLSNPGTLDPLTPGTNAIANPDTNAAAALFNACYTTLLLVLVKYYRFDENSDNQDALQGISKGLMMNVLAKLGPLLSSLPGTGDKNGGPPFEIYTLPVLPDDRNASLKVIRERFGILKAEAVNLATKITQGGVMQRIAQQLDAIAQTIPA